jgi:hypothetical protein
MAGLPSLVVVSLSINMRAVVKDFWAIPVGGYIPSLLLGVCDALLGIIVSVSFVRVHQKNR